MDQELDKLVDEILDASKSWRRSEEEGKDEDDRSAGKIMRILYNSKEEVNPTDLCRQLHVTTPRITVILNDLESRGMIERHISSRDRRRICVTLTDNGREHVARHRQKHREEIERLVKKVGADDARAYLRVIKTKNEMNKM